MKTLKTFAVSTLALASASMAFAVDPVIKITGSSAFRAATYQAIGDILVSPYQCVYQLSGTPPSPNYAGGLPAAFSKATSAIFKGTIKTTSSANGETGSPGIAAGTQVIIKCFWTGSVGGISTVNSGATPPFYGNTGAGKGGWIADSAFPADTSANTTTVLNGNTTGGLQISALSSTPLETATSNPADIVMSDTFEATYFGTTNLLDQVVGVVTFAWARGQGMPTVVTNITAGQAFNLISGGSPLSQLTGTTTDTYTVRCLGRDEDSGTRIGAFAETGFGIFSNCNQYQVNGTPPTTTLAKYIAQSVNGVSYGSGHSGYSSGGNLVTALTTTLGTTTNAGALNATNTLSQWTVGYAGISDLGSLTGTCGKLTFNGFSDADINVQTGRYTFWEYEHLMYPLSYAGSGQAVADQIAKQLHDVDATISGVNVGTMKYGKTSEGGQVTSGNPYP